VRDRDPEREPEQRQQRERDECADHRHVTLREAGRPGGLVDEDEALGDQAADAALGDAADENLQDRQTMPRAGFRLC
jgi:hypothetical protein